MAGKIALDTGAFIALTRGDDTVRAILERWTRAGFETVVACPVLAETLRGKPSDASVHRVVKSRSRALTILPVLEDAARDAGLRLGRTNRKNLTLDALIVATSVSFGASEILTGDPGDVEALSGADLSMIQL